MDFAEILPIVYPLAAAIVGAVVVYVQSRSAVLLKQSERRAQKESLQIEAKTVVQALEQMANWDAELRDGAVKYARAAVWVTQEMQDLGYEFSEDAIRYAIESAVKRMSDDEPDYEAVGPVDFRTPMEWTRSDEDISNLS